MVPPSEEYSRVNALGLIKASLLALCSADKAAPTGLMLPLREGPPQSRCSSPPDVRAPRDLSDKSANFVGTLILAVAFPLWFAVKVATVDPFFWIVSCPLFTVGIVGLLDKSE